MNVLCAFESSGSLRNAFTLLGHNAWSCDVVKTSSPGQHYVGDVFDLCDSYWDLVFAFPPCTYLAKAQMFRYHNNIIRSFLRDNALNLVSTLYNSFSRIAIENPAGYLNNHWKAPSQILHPWYFGDPYNKDICLWLKDCPPVIATKYSVLRKSVSNHVNSRMSQAHKSIVKSSWSYYPEMCKAIAEQYSTLL